MVNLHFLCFGAYSSSYCHHKCHLFCWRTQNIFIYFFHAKILLCVIQALANSKSILLVQKRVILLDGAGSRHAVSPFKSYNEHLAQRDLFLQTSSYSLAVLDQSVLPSLQYHQQLQLTWWVTCTLISWALGLGLLSPLMWVRGIKAKGLEGEDVGEFGDTTQEFALSILYYLQARCWVNKFLNASRMDYGQWWSWICAFIFLAERSVLCIGEKAAYSTAH